LCVPHTFGGPVSQPHLLLERNGPVMTVIMNRPEARNAWSLEMMARLADAWAEIDQDPAIRVAILTGAGDTFCAGADLKLMHADQSDNPWHARFREDPDLHWRAMLRNQGLAKPLICAIEGVAYGGGTEIIQTTDIRVAGEGARMALTEARLGLFPLGGSTVRLPRQVPYTRAMEILLTGEPISAAEAREIGLIGRVVPDGQALNEALRIAEKIAENGPLAVQAIKASVRAGLDLSEEDALAKELEIGTPVFKSEDAREGPRAFAEKRKPVFKGQ